MSTVQLQNLLGYINGLSLSARNRRWLAEHLIMPEETTETPNQKYVRESLTRAMKEVREAEKAGRPIGSPVEDLIAELEKENAA